MHFGAIGMGCQGEMLGMKSRDGGAASLRSAEAFGFAWERLAKAPVHTETIYFARSS
jgi:hypothetical protein